MAWKNTDTEYGGLSIAIHWLMATLIAIQFALGFYAEQLPKGLSKFRWVGYHKSLGFTLLMLALLRLLWTLGNRKPQPLTHAVPWQRRLADANHVLLYLLMIAIPLVGWLLASVSNLPISFWGLFIVPDLLEPDKTWIEALRTLHWIFGYTMLAAILLHVGGGFYHLLKTKQFRMGIVKRSADKI